MPEQQAPHGGFWPKWPENKLFTFLLSFILVLAAIWLFTDMANKAREYKFIGKAEVRDTIFIDGEGVVIGVPDVAQVSIGMMTEAEDVVRAQTENTSKMNTLIDKIKGFNIEAKDIQTTNYSIFPRYDWPDGRQVLRGYQVSQTARIKIRNLDKIGAILKAAGESGANQISGISFTIDDPEVLRQQAREEALQNAFTKAQALAKQAGVKLGKVISFSEYSPSEPYPYKAGYEALGMGGGAPIPSPTIESGSLEIKVNVSVGYEIL